MKILTYKNLNMGETIINFLILLFQQAFFLIFILIVINLTIDEFNNEEIDFYLFYVNLLSKKENQDKKVLVGYNGIDGKEVTISELKDDINKIRDSKSTFI